MANAFFNVDGPIHLYFRQNWLLSASYVYLGTTVRSPKIIYNYGNERTMNAIGGVNIHTDKAFQGHSAMIVCPMNRTDDAQLDYLKRYISSDSVGSGQHRFVDMGRLAEQDGRSISLVMVNSFFGAPGGLAVTPAFAGKTFPCVTLEPQTAEDEKTTVPRLDTLVFEATRLREPLENVGQFYNCLYTLWYSGIPDNLPAPNIS
jgi:hypothetical protein